MNAIIFLLKFVIFLKTAPVQADYLCTSHTSISNLDRNLIKDARKMMVIAHLFCYYLACSLVFVPICRILQK